MHTNQLANYQRTVAIVLHLMVNGLNEGQPTTVLLGVVKVLKAVWRHTRDKSFRNITIDMLTNPDKPRDKSPLLKGEAAEVKHLTTSREPSRLLAAPVPWVPCMRATHFAAPEPSSTARYVCC